MTFGDWNGDGDVNLGESMLTGALIAEVLDEPAPDGGNDNGGGGCGCNLGGMGCVAAALFAFSAVFYGIVKFIRMLIS